MKNPIKIDHFGEYTFPGGLKGCPGQDGVFCFTTQKANFEENKYDQCLWLWRGGELRRLTPPGELRGTWWMDENTLLLARPGSEKDKDREKKGLPATVLQTLPVNGPGEGQEMLRLHHAPQDVIGLADGRLLLLLSYSPDVQAALDKAEGDAAKAAEALAEEADYEVLCEVPFWSNGGGFTGSARGRLYVWERGSLTALTDEATDVEAMRLSPDGGTVYYIGTAYTAIAPLHNQLFALDLSGGEARELSVAAGFTHTGMLPLPCGGLLVAAADRKAYGINQNAGFWRVNAATGEALALPKAGTYSLWNSVGTDLNMAGNVRWFAREGQAIFNATLDEDSHLMAIDTQSGEVRRLTREAGAVAEALPDGDGFIVLAMRGLRAPELYRLAPDGAETRLTDFNTAVFDRHEWVQPRPLCFTNSEGTEIRGWVLLPPGLAQGQKCPAILDIHGGPKTVYGTVAYHEMQYWAHKGWAVLFCNPTGGDGRGDAFADIRGKYGTVDYDDLMAFVNAALAAYPALDETRLGVTGGSYGGFMTNWIIGHTNRFKAAASQRSIANWLGFTCTSDIGYRFGPDQTAAGLWDDAEKLWWHSPLKYADKVKTPTLFIHSDEDYRCPLPEGLQMVTALIMHGVPARLCLFHGENHELSRSGKPKHRLRRLREITEWFEKYL